VARATKHPKRLRRSESFLGIHFDFHAGDDCKEIGKTVTREMVENVIARVKPDWIQCDCKGHPGLSSYPTKVGHPAPGFVRDPLRIWRDVTAEHGVALYMHYSGVFDSEAVRRHPSWARVDEKGKRDKSQTSVFGPYVDKLLIPQFRELADVYGVDGVWVDGECWATVPEYDRKVLKAFREATGIRSIPRKREAPHYFEFLEFCREGFRRYLRHYADEIHRTNPDFQIASNWSFTSFMPEPVSADVDYISGDYSAQNSVNAARLEARYIASQGQPWDLMAWGFSGRWGEGPLSTKSAVQLQQESAVVLQTGGGFQVYYAQKRDASVRDWTMEVMAEVARFCRARQKVCHGAKAVPQVALLNSTAGFYRKSKRLFSTWEGELLPLGGILNGLLESQQSVEILGEHHLAGRLKKYPLVVVPEWDYLAPGFRKDLVAYVERGGKLLLIGPRTAAMFRKELGVKLSGKAAEKSQWLEHGGRLAGVKSLSQVVKPGRRAKPFGRLYPADDRKGPFDIAASVAKYGKGKIAAVYLNLGERCRKAKTSVVREFLGALVRELFPQPMVEVVGSQYVDVQVNRIDGKLAVNLVNTAGPHHDENVHVFEEIPPIGPLAITIRTGARPGRVTLEPGGKRLPFKFRDGAIRLTLPRLEIHSVIVVEIIMKDTHTCRNQPQRMWDWVRIAKEVAEEDA